MSHLDRSKGSRNLPLIDASRTTIPPTVRAVLVRMKMMITIVEMIEILQVNADCKGLVKVVVLHAAEILVAEMSLILDPAQAALATFG